MLLMLRSHGAIKVTLVGGEPTMHPHLTQVIKDAKGLGYKVVLDTNGSFPPELFGDGAFTSLDAISFSIDGHCAQVHDAIRGGGSFKQAIWRLTRANQKRLPIKVTHTASRRNIGHLNDMYEFAVAAGVNELNIHVATFNGRARITHHPDILTPDEWYSAYQAFRDYVAGREPRPIVLRVPPRYCTPAELERVYRDHMCVAAAGDRMLILPLDAARGDLGGPLYACGLMVGERSTLGWNVDGRFQFNGDGGEYPRYYSQQLPNVQGIVVCPVMYRDGGNLNHVVGDRLVPLCISYKPPLLRGPSGREETGAPI
jgi:hypothetical protein